MCHDVVMQRSDNPAARKPHINMHSFDLATPSKIFCIFNWSGLVTKCISHKRTKLDWVCRKQGPPVFRTNANSASQMLFTGTKGTK